MGYFSIAMFDITRGYEPLVTPWILGEKYMDTDHQPKTQGIDPPKKNSGDFSPARMVFQWDNHVNIWI